MGGGAVGGVVDSGDGVSDSVEEGVGCCVGVGAGVSVGGGMDAPPLGAIVPAGPGGGVMVGLTTGVGDGMAVGASPSPHAATMKTAVRIAAERRRRVNRNVRLR